MTATLKNIVILPPESCPVDPEKAIGGTSPCQNYTFDMEITQKVATSEIVAADGATIQYTAVTPMSDSIFEVVVPIGHFVVAHFVWDLAPACPPIKASRVTRCRSDCCDVSELEYCWPTSGSQTVMTGGRYRFQPQEAEICVEQSAIGTVVPLTIWLEPVARDYLLALSATQQTGCGCGGFATLTEN